MLYDALENWSQQLILTATFYYAAAMSHFMKGTFYF